VILCVTANAAVDRTLVVPEVRLNEIHRPETVLALPGGKGCNVARALRRLGEAALVTGWVGGFNGKFIEAELQRESIETAFVQTGVESRICTAVVDRSNRTPTEFNERGESIPPEKLDELIEQVRTLLPGSAAVALSGSLPAGVPSDFYSRLIMLAHEAGVPALLDASGDALKQGVTAKPMLIKPNRAEFTDLVGRECGDIAEYAAAATQIARQYETRVILSLGADGALAADGRSVVHALSQPVDVISAVGSGDCLLGGLAAGLTRGLSLVEALRSGVAAGTANTLRLGAGLFEVSDYVRLHAGVTVAPIWQS
jgi:1-phosphofructokinase family hexose kinase